MFTECEVSDVRSGRRPLSPQESAYLEEREGEGREEGEGRVREKSKIKEKDLKKTIKIN